MKKSAFSLYEVIFIIIIVGILSTLSTPTKKITNLEILALQIKEHIWLTRLKAMSDNIYTHQNKDIWHKSRWSIKFMNCDSSVGGIYYVVYKDENLKGSPNKTECVVDPVSKKYLYSNNDCVATEDEDHRILITKEYDISKIIVSCNQTTTIGQLAFGRFGEVYTKLSDSSTDNLLKEDCFIDLYNKNNIKKRIQISHITGIPEIL